jgi:hypothetical protein
LLCVGLLSVFKWFEVIIGKSIKTEGGGAKVFAFVNKYDTSKRLATAP